MHVCVVEVCALVFWYAFLIDPKSMAICCCIFCGAREVEPQEFLLLLLASLGDSIRGSVRMAKQWRTQKPSNHKTTSNRSGATDSSKIFDSCDDVDFSKGQHHNSVATPNLPVPPSLSSGGIAALEIIDGIRYGIIITY